MTEQSNYLAGSATGIDLAALEQLARAATPGPWAYHYEGGGDYPVIKWHGQEEVEIVCCSRYHCEQDHETMSANAQYLAKLDPQTVLALIALARATPQHSVTEQASAIEEIRGLLQETYGFAAVSPRGQQNINAALDLLDTLATQPLASTAAPESNASKAVYWFSILTKCARLLDLPDDEPIPSGVLRAVESLVASTAATQPEQASYRELLTSAIQRANALAAAGMKFSADLCRLEVDTIGHGEYLPRDCVMSEVAAWRVAFDNAPKVDSAAVRAALAIPASTAPAQQENDQANVLPPTRGTDSQHDAGDSVLLTDSEIIEVLRKEFDLDSDSMPIETAMRAGCAVEEEISRRFRAQGGSTNTPSIPASTAASEQQTWVDAQNETYIRRMQEGAASEQQASVSEADEIVAWRFKRDSQAYPGVPQGEWQFIEHGKNALELQGERGYAASTSHHCWEPLTRAALSGRATIPSEADERADFEKAVRSLTHADDESFKRDEGRPDDYADYVLGTYWSIWKRRAALTHRATTATPGVLLDCVNHVAEGRMDYAGTPFCLICGADQLDLTGKVETHEANCLTVRARAYLAATPDTATTAAVIEVQPGHAFIAPPGYQVRHVEATTAADPQGDTASTSVIGEQRWSKEAEMTASWLASQAQQGAAQALVGALYTCIGKGGEYELIGTAHGAGFSRGILAIIYREVATGVMYHRTPDDFARRMERAAMAAPATSNGKPS